MRTNLGTNRGFRMGNALALLLWLAAGSVAFLPFALNTSPWDAVLFRVPGNQGNWWHLLAAAPFFLAFPMIWVRMRALFAAEPVSVGGRRLIWSIVTLSIAGTLAVETPFLLHLAGTSEWQRLVVLGLGLGTILCGVAVLVRRHRNISSTRASIAALETAYLANAWLCLIVYSEAGGSPQSRIGWMITLAIVWPIALELVWLLSQALRKE